MVASKISLHVFPPYTSKWPMPAVGYIKGYVEKNNPKIRIKSVYWNQSIVEKCLTNEAHLLPSDLTITTVDFYQSIFSYLHLLSENQTNSKTDKIEYVEKCGSLLLTKPSKSDFKRIVKTVDKFFNNEIDKNRYFDDEIVGACAHFGQEIASLTFLNLMKKKNPDVLTVLGGMTSLDAKILMKAFSFIDICVIGEGERTFLKICEQHPSYDSLHEIGGIAYRKNDEIIINKEDPPIEEIDDIWADYEGYDWSLNKEPGLYLPIWDSRGCWWNRCKFCDLNRTSPCHRERKPKNIVKEIEFHLTKISPKSEEPFWVHFLGNDFHGRYKNRCIELLESLIPIREKYPRLTILGEMSPASMTEDVIILLNELQARVQLGFEQWSRMIKVMNKRHNVEHGIYTIKLIEKYPLVNLEGFNFLVGFPGETMPDVYETYFNVWKMRFLIGNLIKNSRTRDFSPHGIYIAATSPLGQTWDFENPLVMKSLENERLAQFFIAIGGKEELARDFVRSKGSYYLFDYTRTAKVSIDLLEQLYRRIQDTTIESYVSTDRKINIIISEGKNQSTTILEKIDEKVLYLTKEITTVPKLQGKLTSFTEEQILRSIENLESLDLLYRRRDNLINTIPHKIQQLVDGLK